MGKQARNYTDKTIKRLFGLSGNQCAFPGCTKSLVNINNAKDANICHIAAANEDGERYDPDMQDAQRADYENLILLCVQHHDETNNEEIYTVEVLKEMRKNHESSYLTQKMNNNPSMLKNTINAIADLNFENFDISEVRNAFNPQSKIDYNAVGRNASLINEYKIYHKKINSLYDELELQGSIKKEKLLGFVKLIYLEVVGKYTLNSSNRISLIRENADNIIDDVYDKLNEKVRESDFWEEDIILGIRLIMVDAFMRCKILEEPVKDDS